MRSVMKHSFSQVPSVQIPRSRFDRNSGWKGTFDGGWLIPFYSDEVLPGDTFSVRATAFARLATPIHPTMDNMRCETFFFFVPNRLIWDNWQRFCGEQDNPNDTTDYLVPQQSPPAGGYPEMSLQDNFGLPTKVEGYTHSALYLRAYNLIWNEWFRDQNLQDSIPVDTGDGPDDVSNYVMRRRNKRHDYFTSCLPFPQKGPAVEINLGEAAPITYTPAGAGVEYLTIQNSDNDEAVRMYADAGTSDYVAANLTDGLGGSPMYANLSEANSGTINALRQAFQIQRMLERDARGGTRYTEINRSHFGVISPDARLQRPEYLGGGSTPVNISAVAQTSSSDATTPQGNLSGIGTVGVAGHGFSKSFTEHGVLIGIINVRADLTYQQGLERRWSRQTRYDYYWPSLAHLGEQAVTNKEIYCQGTAEDDGIFGYQERYGEYRYKPSIITGRFRSNSAVPLDAWHLSQDFQSLPLLNDSWIQDNPPIDRIIAVQDEPHFICDAYVQQSCVRPMPMYGVPGLIDHF